MTTSPVPGTPGNGPRTVRVAVEAGTASSGVGPADAAEFVREAERLGAHAAWVPEMWGYDALTQLGYLAARTSAIRLGSSIVQIGARTPAMLAMPAMSLQQLTGGRFVLGVGVSGPQVMEGWHGVPFRNRPACGRVRVHDRRDGVRDEELLQRCLRPPGIRGGDPGGSATVARRPPGRGRPARPARDRREDQPAGHPGHDQGNGSAGIARPGSARWRSSSAAR